MIAALPEAGFDGYLIMEVGVDRCAVDADSVARRAYEYIKPLVA